MADNTVRIVLDATDNASRVLGQAGGRGGIIGSFTELASVVGLAKQGFAVANQVIDKTVGLFADYAVQVRQLKTEIGATPEEASKLIQVADDMGVSFGELTTAMRGAIRKGIEPTVAGLGQLSDAYLKLEPGVERTKFLMDNFGRSGADIARLMELGSDKMNKMGASIEGTSMLMSQQGLDAAEEYRVSLDQLDDSFTQIKLTVGGGVIPVLNKYIKVMLEANAATAKGTRDGGPHNIMLRSQIEATLEAAAENKKFADGYAALKAAMAGATATQITETGVTWAAIQANRYHVTTLSDATLATRLAREANEKLSQAMSDLQTSVAGPLGKEMENFTEQQAEMEAQTEELVAQIDELAGKKYLTKQQKEQLAGLRGELAETNEAIAANVIAHDEATKRILFDLLLQRAAIGGLSDDEKTVLTDIAVKWGLIDNATVAATLAIEQAMLDLAAGESITEVTNQILGLSDAINDIPSYKKFVLELIVKGKLPSVWQEPDSGVEEDDDVPKPEKTDDDDYDPEDPDAPRALGGPVTSGVPYLVGERGPEVIVPNTSGTVIPNDQLAGITIQTLNVYANDYAGGQAAAEAILRVVGKGRKLQAAAGMRYMGTG